MNNNTTGNQTFSDFQLIKVIIVEVQKIVAEALEQMVNSMEIACVTGKAYSAIQCMELLKNDQPDVLLLDIGLLAGNSNDLCMKIKEKYPQIKILVITDYHDLIAIQRVLDAGADGYVLKNSMIEELEEGIYTIVHGERFLCEKVNVTLHHEESIPLEITYREIELLKLIAAGYTLPQQADKLYLGFQTVSGYRQKLNMKLRVRNTVQLLQKAKVLNLI